MTCNKIIFPSLLILRTPELKLHNYMLDSKLNFSTDIKLFYS